ncbi:IS66 family transposase [Bradyrhizobium sp. DASA03007]|uniref:IS66 family transposase n=1 Tax=unclassified Bradyrhizobium TaxID=2631580 RepID=UPI003F723543
MSSRASRSHNGFEPLFDPQKKVLRITRPFCFAHARRGFFELAETEKNAGEGKKGKPISPIAVEAVRYLDALFEIERTINGRDADERRAVRQGKEQAASRGHAHLVVARARNPLALLRGPEAYELHAQALGRLRPLPRRWQDLLDQQLR